MKHLAKTLALFALALTGCAHQSLVSVGDSSAIVGEILDQVNLAVQEAKGSQSSDGPEISSVEVDLQLGASSGANTSFPLGLVFPTAQATQGDLHRVSLTFAPQPASQIKSGVRPDHTLVLAIEEIYRSVARANPNYQFQHGTMQLQCTLQMTMGVSNESNSSRSGGSGSSSSSSSGSSGGSSLKLVPVEVGVSTTREAIQTIILTFGPHKLASSTVDPK